MIAIPIIGMGRNAYRIGPAPSSLDLAYRYRGEESEIGCKIAMRRTDREQCNKAKGGYHGKSVEQ